VRPCPGARPRPVGHRRGVAWISRRSSASRWRAAIERMSIQATRLCVRDEFLERDRIDHVHFERSHRHRAGRRGVPSMAAISPMRSFAPRTARIMSPPSGRRRTILTEPESTKMACRVSSSSRKSVSPRSNRGPAGQIDESPALLGEATSRRRVRSASGSLTRSAVRGVHSGAVPVDRRCTPGGRSRPGRVDWDHGTLIATSEAPR